MRGILYPRTWPARAGYIAIVFRINPLDHLINRHAEGFRESDEVDVVRFCAGFPFRNLRLLDACPFRERHLRLLAAQLLQPLPERLGGWHLQAEHIPYSYQAQLLGIATTYGNNYRM